MVSLRQDHADRGLSDVAGFLVRENPEFFGNASKERASVPGGPPRSAAKHVEFRLLRYVIAVAEELHFGRAAERLHLSAPALSKQIKDLEAVISYRLFERKTREVVLTAAGAAFIAEARQALMHIERALDFGYAASRGDTGVLFIGYSPWFRPSLLVALQSEFADRVPGTRLVLHSAYPATQIELLIKGTLQAGIIELPAYGEGLETQGVWHDDLLAALPEHHPLGSHSEIDRQDLADEPIIWIARALHPALHQSFLESFQRLGYVPRIVHEINTVSELLDLVAAGAGIGFVKLSTVERVREPGVVFRPVTGRKLSIETGVAYRSNNRSEALRSLLQLLREQSA
jgi:DNA-binding transcriptional LysR family regulator